MEETAAAAWVVAARVEVAMAEAAPAVEESVVVAKVEVVPGEAEKAVEAKAVAVMAAEETVAAA